MQSSSNRARRNLAAIPPRSRSRPKSKTSTCNSPAHTEAQFRTIFNSAAIGIALVDFSGRPQQCNPALERLLGYSEAELCQMTFPEFTHPDDIPADVDLYHRLISGERDYYQLEKRYLRKDGQSVWTRLTISLVRVAATAPQLVIAMVEDISKQKKAEQALQRSEARLRRGLAAARMGAWEWDISTSKVDWSEDMPLLYGLVPGEFGGTLDAFFELVEPADRERVHFEIQQALENPNVQYRSEFRVHWPSSAVRWLEGRGEVVRDAEGKPLAMLGTVVDITERKRAEEGMRQAQERELRSHEKFAQQLLNAEEQERQRLAAELHDGLGQSLSIVKNKSDLALRRRGLPESVAQQLNTISQATSDAIEELRALVRNLRPIQIEQLGLTDSIRDLVDKVAQSTTIQLEHRIENADDAILGPSATQLYRIIQEALNNIIKHSSAARAFLSLERDIQCVRLLISDDGRGFDTAKVSLRGGFGLKNIQERARMIGGRANVQSNPGAGTRLVIEVPIAKEKAESNYPWSGRANKKRR
jgi:PAS domain S-box-containing protein